jgi:hypothetical protein
MCSIGDQLNMDFPIPASALLNRFSCITQEVRYRQLQLTAIPKNPNWFLREIGLKLNFTFGHETFQVKDRTVDRLPQVRGYQLGRNITQQGPHPLNCPIYPS